MVDAADFSRLIIDNLHYQPTGQQVALIDALSRFCNSPQGPDNEVFLLNGYAGTGKTSVVGAMVKALAAVGRRSVLLAPTGRAAKVFSRFAGHPAYTIHRRIYHTDPDSGEFNALAENTARPGTVFIVDEASMIGADNHVTCTSLLDDLIQYVYMSDGCRLILLGDTAQLPPVGCTESPAMSRDVLRSFGLKVTRVVLTATVRQAVESGVLYNATWLRKAMRIDPLPVPQLTLWRLSMGATFPTKLPMPMPVMEWRKPLWSLGRTARPHSIILPYAIRYSNARKCLCRENLS